MCLKNPKQSYKITLVPPRSVPGPYRNPLRGPSGTPSPPHSQNWTKLFLLVFNCQPLSRVPVSFMSLGPYGSFSSFWGGWRNICGSQWTYSPTKILFAHLCLSPTLFNSLHIAQCTSLQSGLVGGWAFWASRHKLPVPYLKVGYKSHPRSLWVIFDPFKVNNSSVYTTLPPIHKKLRHYLVIIPNLRGGGGSSQFSKLF